MIGFPNAKINLGLFVTEKREDGFHNIETLFYPIPLTDVLEVKECDAGADRLYSYGIPMDGAPEDNLVMRAVRRLRRDFSFPFLDFHLMKNIPFGAGLGGGSADATEVLQLMNKKFSLQLTDAQMENVAAELGSDCAFFVRNRAVFARGCGEQMEDIQFSLRGFRMILIVPPLMIRTAEAYARIIPKKAAFDLRMIKKLRPEQWKTYIRNDFEEALFPLYPDLKKIKEQLYDSGAVYASMSGSGSAIYGLFEDTIEHPVLLQDIRYLLQTTFDRFHIFDFNL